jgi:hypothetical protein
MVNFREGKKNEDNFEQDLIVVHVTSKKEAPCFAMKTLTQGEQKQPRGECAYAFATDGNAADVMYPC